MRRARPSDAKVLAEIFRESWRNAYRGIIPHAELESAVLRRDSDWWQRSIRANDTILVLEIERKLAGYATCGPARGRRRHQGEIYELYLAPIYQGLGLGEHLFEGCRHNLDSRGLAGLLVWSLADNTPAIDFYWRRGGRPVARASERFGKTRLAKLAFGWA